MEKGLYINETTFVPLNQLSADLTKEVATRQFAMGFYPNFFNYLPDPDPILRKLNRDQEVYKDLLADEQVGSLYQRRKNLTKCLDWDVDANNVATDTEMNLCKKALDILEINGCKIKDIISQTLNPVGFGYSVFELNWRLVNNTWFTVKAWEKPREWFSFDWDNQLRFRPFGNYEGYVIKGEDAEAKYLTKFILLQNDPSYENPYGDKALSRCFWPVTFKRGGMRFFADFVERFGMPFIYGKLPRTASSEEHAKLFNQLLSFINGAIGTGPDDSSIEVLEAKGTSNGDLHEKFLQRNDNAISKALLGNALSTDIQKVGGRASSETGAETIESDISETDRDFPTAFFNELFRRLVDLNIGSGRYPIFKVKELLDVNTPQAERDGVLSDKLNVKFTKKYIGNSYHLEDDDFEIVEPTAPAPAGNNLPGSAPKIFLPDDTPTKTELSFFTKFWNKLTGRIDLAAGEKDIAGQIVNGMPEKSLQFAMEQTLKPVIDLAKGSTSREEFQTKLAELYPDMPTGDMQTLMTQASFLAKVKGDADAQDEAKK